MEEVTVRRIYRDVDDEEPATIVERHERNNVKVLKLRGIDESVLGFDEGVLFSYPNGTYYVTYADGRRERFELLDTIHNTDYTERETPMTLDEIYAEISKKLKSTSQISEEKLAEAISRYAYASDDRTARLTIIKSINTLWSTANDEFTVYRGQTVPEGKPITAGTQIIRTAPESFFSTSTEIDVSTMSSFFSHEYKCCVFILHIQPGVKYFDVGDLSPRGEYEYLIEGNGTFYQDRQRSSTGFRQFTLGDLVNNIELPHNLYLYKQFFMANVEPSKELSKEELVASTKLIDPSELQKRIGVFEAYYFPPTREGGRRRRKTYRNKKNRRQTRKRT